MPSSLTILLILVFVFAFCLSNNGVYAFGAGNIPSFAYMEGRAFRHGDIEDTLAELAKGGGFALSSLIGGKGPKFGGLDIKRVYFGNWLRDYSQAMDIAGLKKLQTQTIINLCMALGFLAHGYATNEFEVTEERLAVYLPTEHIDNPKGYGDGEDARKYHPKLRPPVQDIELEIDPRTGMKNYIANENGSWDTSKALVRRTIEQCVRLGRQHKQSGQKADLYEAYRLLGQLLHTLEDFPAHSNFCEIALVAMGHHQVFQHVGDQVRIQAPNRKWVAPIVTGTFGSSDFIHSLLGEATDHISQASVTDLNKEMENARSRSRGGPGSSATGSGPGDALRELLFKIPGGGGSEMSRDMESIERIRAGPAAGGKRPEDMSPQELHAVLWQVLTFRDSVVKKIEKTIEKIPGLGPLIEKLMDSISVFVFTTLEPFLKPIMKTATTGLGSASAEVIDNHDQYEVFNDPRASDPTHSFLSKDHFNLILNEPAGNLAKIILSHTVQLIAKAWGDTSMNVNHVSEDILQCLFHPDFHNSQSKVQREMMQYMRDWLQKLGNRQHDVLRRLSKEAVRNHENIRLAGEGGLPETQGSYAYNQGINVQHNLQGYAQQIPGVAQASNLIGGITGNQGPRRDMPEPAAPGGGGGGSYPGADHGHAHHQHGPAHHQHAHHQHTPSSGQAASYYNEGAPSFPGGGALNNSPNNPPTAPPPGPSGYSPSYSSPPPPSFPEPPTGGFGGNPGYPPPGGGYPPPPGGPGFPGPMPYGGQSQAQFPGGPGGYPPPGGYPAPGGSPYPPPGGRPPGW